jgi:hypothetical protein
MLKFARPRKVAGQDGWARGMLGPRMLDPGRLSQGTPLRDAAKGAGPQTTGA